MEEYEYRYRPAPEPARRSPFADSPYECVIPMDDEPAVSAPAAPVKNKKCGAKILAVVAIMLILCIATNIAITCHWQSQKAAMEQAMEEKFAALEQLFKEYRENVSIPLPEEGPLTPAQVYSKNVKAVVAVTCQYKTDYGYGESSGSGFIITADGYVVTNYHVIEGAQQISVQMTEGKALKAQVVGYEPSNDIAVLKVQGENLPIVELGSSDALIVGDQVSAIGNPLGELTSTLTVGYISAKDRVITTDGSVINMLQTDAAINAGNSGGPLFNMYGQVVGIITAKYSNNGSEGASIEGLGFAIPIDDVKGMIEDLMEFGYIKGAYLGVTVRDVNQEGQSYGLPAGAYIEEVVDGLAADKAGLRSGDIITALGGYDVDSLTGLTRALRRFEPGDNVVAVVYRVSTGETLYLKINLGEKPTEQNQGNSNQGGWFDDFFGPIFGD